MEDANTVGFFLTKKVLLKGYCYQAIWKLLGLQDVHMKPRILCQSTLAECRILILSVTFCGWIEQNR